MHLLLLSESGICIFALLQITWMDGGQVGWVVDGEWSEWTVEMDEVATLIVNNRVGESISICKLLANSMMSIYYIIQTATTTVRNFVIR